MLAADKPYTENPNLSEVKRIGEKEWQSGKMTFKPISEAYLMDKEALTESRFGLCF